MAEAVEMMLAGATIPGVGPIKSSLMLVRNLYTNMHECSALCDRLQKRLDALWTRLLDMESNGTLPKKFKLEEYTDIVTRFHALVLQQAQKSIILRIGTCGSFMAKIQACHEEVDQLCESLRFLATESILQWRVDWETDTRTMTDRVKHFADMGVAVRMNEGGVTGSLEAVTVLAHEKNKLVDRHQIVDALQTICLQLARQNDLTVPASLPPWFFAFDDIEIDPNPFNADSASSTAMGTVHRARWGPNTNVIVKKIELLTPHKASSSFTWREADVWWRLNHPNVLRMFGACHVTQPALLICEEAQFGNIRDYLATDSRRLDRFWRLQLDVAVGLVHLKEHHVVHGNLKLNNILVGDDGRAKIADFGFSYIRDPDNNDHNDTVLTEDSDLDSAAVAPYAASWPAPEMRAAAERGDRMVPSYESDVFAFAVCMMQLLSNETLRGNEQALARLTLNPTRPPGISDDVWDLIKRMCCQEPSRRPAIRQVMIRLQRLAEDEAGREAYFRSGSSCSSVESSAIESEVFSQDVDSRRAEYEQQRSARSQRNMQHGYLELELEDLRQKIRDEERRLESIMEKRQQAEAEAARVKAQATSTGDPPVTALPPRLSTKQLLRHLKWGTTEEQTLALAALDANQMQHSADEIVRSGGVDVLVGCVKFGHSSAFRKSAIDVLQSVTSSGTGLFLDPVLDLGVIQLLMAVLHYRRIPSEQVRAGQYLVLLACQSQRARSFFLRNSGVELLVKALLHGQIAVIDRHIADRCDPTTLQEMRQLLATQAEVRTAEADRAVLDSRGGGSFDVALQKYTEAIVLDPRNGRLYAKRSAVYATMRKYDHAAKDAELCIRLLPKYGGGYFRHAIALYKLGKVRQADRAVRQGKSHDRQYFTEARVMELATHAPRERLADNAAFWTNGSVDF